MNAVSVVPTGKLWAVTVDGREVEGGGRPPGHGGGGRAGVPRGAGRRGAVAVSTEGGGAVLRIIPCTITDAKIFVAKYHRHNLPPVSALFACAVQRDKELCGVAIVGRPVARMLQDGLTCEVLRTCTDGTRNANSILYGACLRAARALGYRRVVTYTLIEEGGASLKAAGWKRDVDLVARPTWDTPSRPREQQDLFSQDRRPPGAKIRWVWEMKEGSGA